MEERLPVGVHLVGSVPLGSAEEVFRRAAGALGDRLRRIPDGETGARSDWIVWQYPLFSSRPEFEIGPPGVSSYRALPQLRLRAGADARTMAFDELGYAAAAIASYRTFAQLKDDGVVPRRCRFLVSLPSPLAPVSAFVSLEHQAEIEPVYEAAMQREVERIVAAIPAGELAIQWDARYEFAMLEGAIAVWFDDVQGGVVERLERLARAVPAPAELGFHLCYGDDEHGHFAEPADAGKLVAVAAALATTVERALDWIHLPVPHDRRDDAYFAPLGGLRLPPGTELYLGLLHPADGAEGARARIAAAQRHVEGFGVATECGWGRGGAAAVDGLLALHRAVSAPLPDGDGAAPPAFAWPEGFDPHAGAGWSDDEPGLAYDRVDAHGWYRTLDLTAGDLAATLDDGDLLVDYSGGTGTLLDRLRLRMPGRRVGVLLVDPSARFLHVARAKYAHPPDPLVALRQSLDDVPDEQADALACTNAIHLYPDLAATLGEWHRVLRPGASVFVNSGNIRNPRAQPSEWILDETVWVIGDLAEGLVRSDPQYVHWREAVDDAELMTAHAEQRNRVFVPTRPLEAYLDALREAGFELIGVREETIEARVGEWFEFLSAYHDAVLGWVGGPEPTPAALRDRLRLIRHAMETLFAGRPSFNACWTYITARKPSTRGQTS
jgi:ubiquinone/menaquinone biosynthesis C-methylase UbiE